MAILVVSSVLGVIGLVAAVMAWRGSRVALRVCAGAIIVITLTGLPAFFVDVPIRIQARRRQRGDHGDRRRAHVLRPPPPRGRRRLTAAVIAIVTVLAAFPRGFFLSSRLAATTTYAVAILWAFTFQTLYLVLDSLSGGSAPAFGVGEFPVSYAVVTLAVLLAGIGLVQLGHRVGATRRGRRSSLATA